VRLDPKRQAADKRLQREYGISLTEYEQVLKYQNGVCAICSKAPLPGRPRLSVDHCHTTGQLRGLLCHSCNRAIAVFKDDADRMQKGADYIRRPPLFAVLGFLITAPGRVGTKKRAALLKKLKQRRT
jgi:hypothetical protein